MKKLSLIVLAIIVFALVSCEECKVQKSKEGNVIGSYTMNTIEYKGHEYILFYEGFGKCATSGITHSPDCPCGR